MQQYFQSDIWHSRKEQEGEARIDRWIVQETFLEDDRAEQYAIPNERYQV